MTEPEPQANIAEAGCTFVLYFLLGLGLILVGGITFFLICLLF